MNGNTVHGSFGNLSKTKHRHMLSFNYGKLNAKFIPGKTAMRKSTNVYWYFFITKTILNK